MGFTDVYDEKVKEAISFFNSLTNVDRAIIVSDLSPDIIEQNPYYESIKYLLLQIQHDIIGDNDIHIGNHLMKMGLDETWARLLVVNTKKHAPSTSYLANQLNRVDEKRFENTIGDVMDALWMKNMTNDAVTEKFGVDEDQINSITRIVKWYMREVMTGNIGPITALSIMVENELSSERAEALFRVLADREKDWYWRLLLSHTLNNYYDIQEIKGQNAIILEALDDISK